MTTTPKIAFGRKIKKTVTKPIGGAKNGGTRTVYKKRLPRFFPLLPLQNRNHKRQTHKTCPLRKSITPGTVLILLAGRFKGKRVVFLKQLESGLLLVTGPFKVNGVPLRRVNQRYVIATSAKVPLTGVDTATIPKESELYPKVSKKKLMKFNITPKGGSKNFFRIRKTIGKVPITESYKNAQKAVDEKLIPNVEQIPFMKDYLRSSFSLKPGQLPHVMRF